jgi:cystathionine beta-lyase
VAVAEKICALEGGEKGLVLSSGMAAESTVLFSLLKQGDHAIFQAGLYGGTQQLIAEFIDYGIKTTIVNSTQVDDFANAIENNTILIFLETPTNPLLKVTDLSALAQIAKKRNILTIVDNTFATPINQNPLKLGIDVVTHSGTKYLNGHSDVICGAIVSSEKLMDQFLKTEIRHGGCLNIFDCYLLERGLKTLGIRVTTQNRNAQTIAEYLKVHSRVKKVYYPGLTDHPDYEVARKQMLGFGGMLSFELDADKQKALEFSAKLKIITPAVSLGGVETILCFPADTSHIKVPPEERLKQGISDTLIRLSVGIEDVEDLIADLEKGLKGL